jgi:hypothetical protein
VPTLHVLAVVIGAALVVVTMADVVRRLVIPRARASALPRAVDAVVDGLFQSVVRRLPDYQDKDRVLAGEPAMFLLMRLGVLLLVFEIEYALLLWPWTDGFATALREAGSSLFTFEFVASPGGVPTVINVLAAATGLVVICGIQSPGDRRDAAQRPGGLAAVGSGTVAAYPVRGTRAYRRLAAVLRPVGAVGGRCSRKPRQLPGAGALPLTAAAIVLARRAAGGDGFSGDVSGAVPQPGTGSSRGWRSAWGSPRFAKSARH